MIKPSLYFEKCSRCLEGLVREGRTGPEEEERSESKHFFHKPSLVPPSPAAACLVLKPPIVHFDLGGQLFERRRNIELADVFILYSELVWHLTSKSVLNLRTR